jgi:NAD(P)-dependent dehydrogenase (short-subunit alcohol dehydrogenase family)
MRQPSGTDDLLTRPRGAFGAPPTSPSIPAAMTTEPLFPGAIVVTGSNGGLGKHVVSFLLSAGVRDIVCHYRSANDGVMRLLSGSGLVPDRHLFRADLEHEGEAQALADATLERFGRVWGIVNLAGSSSNAMSWKLGASEFQRIVNANLLSTFLSCRAFLPGMREAGGGRIVNISSVVAHAPLAGAAHYCAAKAGIEGLTRAIAVEVAAKKVTVNCLALGYFNAGIIETVPAPALEMVKGRIPLARLGDGAEAAAMIHYLLDVRAGFITGQVLHVNGGQYLA